MKRFFITVAAIITPMLAFGASQRDFILSSAPVSVATYKALTLPTAAPFIAITPGQPVTFELEMIGTNTTTALLSVAIEASMDGVHWVTPSGNGYFQIPATSTTKVTALTNLPAYVAPTYLTNTVIYTNTLVTATNDYHATSVATAVVLVPAVYPAWPYKYLRPTYLTNQYAATTNTLSVSRLTGYAP